MRHLSDDNLCADPSVDLLNIVSVTILKKHLFGMNTVNMIVVAELL